MRAHCLALALLLAGCAAPTPGGSPSTTNPPATAEANVLPWDLEACAVVMGLVEVPLAAVQERAPAGFQVVASNGAGPTELTTVGIEAFQCSSASGLGASLTNVGFGGLWAIVEPDAAVAVAGAQSHFLRLDFLAVDPGSRSAFIAAGAPAFDGDADAATGGLGPVTGSLTLNGVGTFTITGVELQERTSGNGYSFAEYAPADGGVATWRLAWENGGTTTFQGTVQLPQGSWLADALGGATVVPATIEAGTWSFFGNVTLPP